MLEESFFCEHGLIRRGCEICTAEREIAELRAIMREVVDAAFEVMPQDDALAMFAINGGDKLNIAMHNLAVEVYPQFPKRDKGK